MLRLCNDGSILLTMNGKTIATIDRIAAAEMSAAQLVQWENQIREEHYERSQGFWCQKNQAAARAAEISPERAKLYPGAAIMPEKDFNLYWGSKREMAIDN